MIRAAISVIVITNIVCVSSSLSLAQNSQPSRPVNTVRTVAQAPLTREAEKIRAKVQNLGVAHNVTVVLKNGNAFYGAITKIDNAVFELAEVDLKQTVIVVYDDVKKVRGSYGDRNISGKRINPKTERLVIFGVLGGLFALILVAVPKT